MTFKWFTILIFSIRPARRAAPWGSQSPTQPCWLTVTPSHRPADTLRVSGMWTCVFSPLFNPLSRRGEKKHLGVGDGNQSFCQWKEPGDCTFNDGGLCYIRRENENWTCTSMHLWHFQKTIIIFCSGIPVLLLTNPSNQSDYCEFDKCSCCTSLFREYKAHLLLSVSYFHSK